MHDNISPEERLLRLIRGDGRESSRKDEKITKDLDASQSERVIQEQPTLRKKPTEKSSLSGKFNLGKIKEHFSFNQINRILLAIFLILGVYLLADFLITSPNRIEKRILAPLAPKEIKGVALGVSDKTPAEGRFKPISYYSEPVKSRNLFTTAASKTEQVRPSPSFLEMVSKLKLQGIISGANPQAVIEDTKTKQVYFLSPGERISEMELKEILPGKVKLNYYGQELELAL